MMYRCPHCNYQSNSTDDIDDHVFLDHVEE